MQLYACNGSLACSSATLFRVLQHAANTCSMACVAYMLLGQSDLHVGAGLVCSFSQHRVLQALQGLLQGVQGQGGLLGRWVEHAGLVLLGLSLRVQSGGWGSSMRGKGRAASLAGDKGVAVGVRHRAKHIVRGLCVGIGEMGLEIPWGVPGEVGTGVQVGAADL